MFIFFSRIVKSGWKYFKRNVGLSAATIFIMVLAISLSTFLFLFQKTSQVVKETLEEKLDIYVYFNEELSSDKLLEIQNELSKISGIKKVEYLSRDEAIGRFIARHKNDQVLMESLRELGKNPLLASMNIQAWETSQYAAISNFLANSQFNEIISKIDYQQKKPVIERISSISSKINAAGITVNIILALVAILVTFNTVRLAINNSKEEIETMRLVGASNNFISGPFMIQGIIAGFTASLITFSIFAGGIFFLEPGLKFLLPGFNLFSYFISNSVIILLIQITGGISLGVISSLLAIRKHLKI